MGKFLIFIGIFMLIFLAGLGFWWLGSKIYLSIQRDQERFDIEKEGYDVVKNTIKKENKE